MMRRHPPGDRHGPGRRWRKGEIRDGWPWLVVVPLVLLIALAPEVPVAWRLWHDQGRTGTWTATSLTCLHPRRCTASGNFLADTGGPVRSQVDLGGRDFQPTVGNRYRAVDVGDGEVYVPGGGRALSVLWIVPGLGVLIVVWAACIVVVWWRRRR
ncbi:hypothetical protein ACWDSJ_28115 [Nocardia sp. NPDC003482]